MQRRVVVTGMGAITSLGLNAETFWENIKKGKSGISLIERFDTTAFKTKFAAEIKDFNAEDHIDHKLISRLDPFCHFTLAAAKMAMDDCGLNRENTDPFRFGAIIGNGVGGMKTYEVQYNRLLDMGPRRVSPFFIPSIICNMAGAQIAIHYGARGVNTTIVTACASGTNAIGESFWAIKSGRADIIITGGVEHPILESALAGFTSARSLSARNDAPEKASRPFDKDRDGFVMGEGAGILVLEEMETALKRRAKIYAELIGYGLTCDAFHMTLPANDGAGATKAMDVAMQVAGIRPDEVDYINAHGTSTAANDKYETLAIKNSFNSHAENVKISSTKSMTGHLLGAAGGIEAIVCVNAINDNFIPPTINYETPDPECDLDYTPNKGVEHRTDIAMSNSFGFGGHNAVILFKRFEN